MKTFVVYVKALYVLTERIAFTSSIIHWYSLWSYGAIVGKYTHCYLNSEWTCVCVLVWMKPIFCICLNVISLKVTVVRRWRWLQSKDFPLIPHIHGPFSTFIQIQQHFEYLNWKYCFVMLSILLGTSFMQSVLVIFKLIDNIRYS